ncbi:MAG TPA: ATP-binding protein, partial [Solirubrobacteraceae bacterium]|nr:ATP-binding protein [Solirubrobacteraceae bacterium]
QSSLAAPGERFAQVLGVDGNVIDATPSLPRRALLDRAQLLRSRAATLLVERTTVAGAKGSSRLLAVPVHAQDQRMLVVVGTSLQQRDSALAELRTVLLLGGPVALALASLLGYAVAALSLRSVESMRRRALHVSLGEPGQRLPVPPSNDELARLARTLNEMIARNELAFQRERAFVADASHELRSPLAILRAELDVALLGDSTREELKLAVASAVEEADRLSVLAEDLLMLAQADQGNLPVHAEAMDVEESLRRLRERFGQRAGEAGATIETQASAGTRVRADPRRLEQALGNLLDNALRHGAQRVLVRAERQGARLELHVSDDGPGFPADFMGVAFERFTRADRPRTAPGAGLGLSIVRSIARAHGGEAYIGNGDGGAHVWLSIPDATPSARPAGERDSSPGGVRPARMPGR